MCKLLLVVAFGNLLIAKYMSELLITCWCTEACSTRQLAGTTGVLEQQFVETTTKTAMLMPSTRSSTPGMQ